MPTVKIAGYAPPSSTHSRALDLLRRRLEEYAPGIEVGVVWNVVDLGRAVGDLLDLVQSGDITMCYLSTSYLVDRVPDLALIDTPYRFPTLESAHRALDGEAGRMLGKQITAATDLEVLGFWDNGFRHLTNRVRAVTGPEDLRGMTVRVQPSPVHERMVELWGGVPVPTDLKEGISLVSKGVVDAQENPLSNTVAYGIDRHHRHVTLTGHVYGARVLLANGDQHGAWSPQLRDAVAGAAREAIEWLWAAAADEEAELIEALRARGHDVVELDEDGLAGFAFALEALRSEVDSTLPITLLEASR